MARYSSRKKNDRPLTILKRGDPKMSGGRLLAIVAFGIVLALGGIALVVSGSDPTTKDYSIEQKSAPPVTTGQGR
jgi:hypothetical protein